MRFPALAGGEQVCRKAKALRSRPRHKKQIPSGDDNKKGNSTSFPTLAPAAIALLRLGFRF
jgi:hypothetical protein